MDGFTSISGDFINAGQHQHTTVRKDLVELNSSINQLTATYIFFSNSSGTFTEIGHIPGHHY